MEIISQNKKNLLMYVNGRPMHKALFLKTSQKHNHERPNFSKSYYDRRPRRPTTAKLGKSCGFGGCLRRNVSSSRLNGRAAAIRRSPEAAPTTNPDPRATSPEEASEEMSAAIDSMGRVVAI